MLRALSRALSRLLLRAGIDARRAQTPQKSEAYLRTHDQLRREVAARRSEAA
jgi:hypothetical protein